jgi:hypothetical protein
MKKLLQTKSYQSVLGRRGNCLATVVACWLDKPSVEDVPNVETLMALEPFGYHLEVLNKWLNHQGYIMRTADESKCYHVEGIEVDMFMDKYGVDINYMKEDLKTKFYMVSGQSPRHQDIRHITIWRAGRLWHDPYPGGTGLYLPKGRKASKEFDFSVIEAL